MKHFPGRSLWIRQKDDQASFLSMTFLLITNMKCQHTMGWFTRRTAPIRILVGAVDGEFHCGAQRADLFCLFDDNTREERY
ncbi:hypothetical protein LEMLEM_LOCUS27683 [Lemmus lemmus]